MKDGHQYGFLAIGDGGALAHCRNEIGWEVLEPENEADSIWLRRPIPDDSDAPKFDPWKRMSFHVRGRDNDHRQFVADGHTVATAQLPEGNWIPLSHWFSIQKPPTQLPGRIPKKAGFAPIRTGSGERPATLHLIDASVWSVWAATAPEIRLSRLCFAASSDDRICVRGTPPPPLPAAAWTVEENLALPAGYGLPPGFLPDWLFDLLGLASDDLVLWYPDGRAESIPASAFLPATRSNVRATAGAKISY